MLQRNHISIKAFMQNVEYTVNFKKPQYMFRLIINFIKSIFTKYPPLRGVDIAITYDCNLRCEHCNIELLKNPNNKILSVDEIKDLINKARKMGLVNITFTGGEVLLKYDRLKEILKAINTKKYLIHLQTNAVLLTEEKIIELKKLGVDKFILSWDPYHDEKDWEIMFETRIKLVKMLKKHKIKTIGVAVAARNVIYTEQFSKMIEITKDLNIWLVFNLPIPLGGWLNNEEILLKHEDQIYIRDLVNKNSHLRLDFDLNFLNYGCPAFTERFHVTTYGDVQPCTFSQITFGNVRTDSLKDVRKRGLDNKTFNTFKKYCPPAEDKRFIYKYWEVMNDPKNIPIVYTDMFDENGYLIKSKRENDNKGESLEPIVEVSKKEK